MAVVPCVVTYADNSDPQSGLVLTWGPVTNADTCAVSPYTAGLYVDRCVQVFGTFGSATMVINGSLDGTNFVGLTDPQGTAISKLAAAIEQIEEAVIYLQPAFSGGGGTQSLTVKVFCTGYKRR